MMGAECCMHRSIRSHVKLVLYIKVVTLFAIFECNENCHRMNLGCIIKTIDISNAYTWLCLRIVIHVKILCCRSEWNTIAHVVVSVCRSIVTYSMKKIKYSSSLHVQAWSHVGFVFNRGWQWLGATIFWMDVLVRLIQLPSMGVQSYGKQHGKMRHVVWQPLRRWLSWCPSCSKVSVTHLKINHAYVLSTRASFSDKL